MGQDLQPVRIEIPGTVGQVRDQRLPADRLPRTGKKRLQERALGAAQVQSSAIGSAQAPAIGLQSCLQGLQRAVSAPVAKSPQVASFAALTDRLS